MNKITSRSNPLFRQLRNLRQQNLILVEGMKLCREALASGLTVNKVLLTDEAAVLPETIDLLQQIPHDVPRVILADNLLKDVADTVTPQGIALICPEPETNKPAQIPQKTGLYLIVDGLQDPGNLGTLIRTADAFAFSAVIITAGTVYPFNDKVIRAAMGSVFRVPIIRFSGLRQAVEWLHSGGVTILAADLNGEDSTRADLSVPAALIIGNEAHGLAEEALHLADRKVGIPMPGGAESLNAAIAGAILSYEMLRARRIKEEQ